MQKFNKGDHVKIADDLGPTMPHFPSGIEAIVEYSYADKYGGSDTDSYSLKLKGGGSIAWYYESQLTLIKANCHNLMEKDSKDQSYKGNNMTHDELVQTSAKWLKKHSQNAVIPNCSIVSDDIKSLTKTGEIPDVFGWCSWCSILIEVKVSRSDYFADKKKEFRTFADKGMGEFRYYICPKDMIEQCEVPMLWGLLYCDDNGNIEIVRRAIQQESNLDSERTLLLSLIRRNSE